ncbi:hypothetical protein SUS17_2869 [Sphingomonas sp. S17]|uniref:DNA, contig: SP626 n=1 Tax=Sphingomonas paucimobilis NBRC 13935 TaxID=1219050 RepID=A0A0C9MSV0_SPHPI|nr:MULTISPECIES: hypothetical protein [Sphingomonas]EGI54378.1 hypothetical protein SUS17_2869 [Sphingomonas sp. S17]MCM3680615.1 hypothetical protein [Sphingomonas paucimobilis]BCI71513.1 hypothetical protein SPKIRA_23430 [Sphingomonas paucimobilis]GAN13781.1 hypothetical protein SP6_26_00450 [Sphingomonas paucimobilis NBRC 13935]
MSFGRVVIGLAIGALAATTALVAPAIGAVDQSVRQAKRMLTLRGAGGFTPAAADPRLAAIFARSGLDAGDLRFTPAESQRGANRAVTVAVRARTSRTNDERIAANTAPTVGLAPISYNLGVSVGWKRLAVSSDIARVDLAGLPGSRETADVAVSYTANRFTGRVKASTDRPIEGVAKLIDTPSSYSLDMGGSYALTRNLDVTAGVRYRSDRERLARLDDDRRNSQAVYLGTAFRF